MTVDLVGLIALSLAMGLAAWLAFMWSVKSGQYEDPEGPKYRILEGEDEHEGPPGAGGPPPAPPGPPPPPRRP